MSFRPLWYASLPQCSNAAHTYGKRLLPSLHILNVLLTVFPICMTWTKFPGTDHFYRKNGSWGTIFPPKISVRGTKIFRTKIPVTVQTSRFAKTHVDKSISDSKLPVHGESIGRTYWAAVSLLQQPYP